MERGGRSRKNNNRGRGRGGGGEKSAAASSSSSSSPTRRRRPDVVADACSVNVDLLQISKEESLSASSFAMNSNQIPPSDCLYNQAHASPGFKNLSSSGVAKLDVMPRSKWQGSMSGPGHNLSSSGVAKLDVMPRSKWQGSMSAPGHNSRMEISSSSARSDPRGKRPSVVTSQGVRNSDTVEIHDEHDNSDSACALSGNTQAESDMRYGPDVKGNKIGQTCHEKAITTVKPEKSDCSSSGVPFDICPKKPGALVQLKSSLLVHNREKRNEKRSMEELDIRVLRPGMVLLKKYISSADQVNLVKLCRELGVSRGGFYQPGYRDGAQLHLRMMCLGMDWDPETGRYSSERRLVDGAVPPAVPKEFLQLVKAAIQSSHVHIQKQSNIGYGETVLPSMSPNICIVNFYTKSGRLGLHQDKDESPESLSRGLPVVSFSLGDSAEFLYGDERDIFKAEKVILESGDVLIFGGKSRLIYHGVSTILPDTAPKILLERSDLRPGRLNLTFRQF